jgi:pyrimidine operon attenuation protein/uracil phosphoribosyltransferase
MKNIDSENIILDHVDVKNIIKRISLEILEDNIDEKEIIFFGISKNGNIIANKIIENIKSKTNINISLIVVKLNNEVKNKISFDKKFNIKNKSIILVSDVSHSSKTLQLVISNLMVYDPLKIKTAVIINRDHSMFPVKVNFSGLNLSTSFNDHVEVRINDQEEFLVHLS